MAYNGYLSGFLSLVTSGWHHEGAFSKGNAPHWCGFSVPLTEKP